MRSLFSQRLSASASNEPASSLERNPSLDLIEAIQRRRLRLHFAERRRGRRQIRGGELRTVLQVNHVGAHLQFHVFPDPEIAQQVAIPLLQAVGTEFVEYP